MTFLNRQEYRPLKLSKHTKLPAIKRKHIEFKVGNGNAKNFISLTYIDLNVGKKCEKIGNSTLAKSMKNIELSVGNKNTKNIELKSVGNRNVKNIDFPSQ